MREYPLSCCSDGGLCPQLFVTTSGSLSSAGSAALWLLKWPECVTLGAEERAQQESTLECLAVECFLGSLLSVSQACLSTLGLSLYRLHDLCLPHTRQTLLHPGPDER